MEYDLNQELFEYQSQIGMKNTNIQKVFDLTAIIEFIWTNYVTDVEDTLIKRLYKPHSFKRVNEYCTKVHL